MNVYLSGIAWVGGAAAVGGGSAYLVRRFGMAEGRASNNDAAGQVFTIVAGLHAVLIAFVLISLLDGVNAASDGSQQEADSLVAAMWSAEALPDPARTQAREIGRAYANTVAHEEWSRMQEGNKVAEAGWAQLDQLRATVTQAPVSGDDEWLIDRKAEAVDRLLEVSQARQTRLAVATDGDVRAVVWFVLLLGSVISVLLPNLFGGTRPVTHVIIVSTLAGTIALLLFGIYQLQNPFSGGVRLEPDAFRWAADRLR